MEKYDLTNKKELAGAIKELMDSPSATALFAVNSPAFLVMKIGSRILDKIDSTKTLQLQKGTAERLIKRGKEDGVDEMEITMENSRGFKLNIPIEDVKIDTTIGADEKMHIKVKYK